MITLITGCAGFIGFSLAKRLLGNGKKIIGIDNINSYYDINLKKSRLKILKKYKHFKFIQLDITVYSKLNKIFDKQGIDEVVHLAAQAGVRYSLTNPGKFIRANEVGFFNIIDLSRKYKIKKFIYASSSSVYGNNDSPYSETQIVNNPINVYAKTKISNELMAKTYSNLYGFETIGLRFFTVYGPWGRPDMAYFKFTKSIFNNQKIQLFNKGKHKRDFTYIDDIINGITLILRNKSSNLNPNVINIGSGKPYNLLSFIRTIEEICQKKAIIEFLPMQIGEINTTHADISLIKKNYNYKINFNLKSGLTKFIEWYKSYY